MNQWDLGIIDEESICAAEIKEGRLVVGDEAYPAVVLPSIDALGYETAKMLERFARDGGIVITAGSLPTLADHLEHHKAMKRMMEPLFEGMFLVG